MLTDNVPKLTQKPRKTHHHGDLRAALVRAALDHVRREGAASFSLRHATAGAGVTSGAAYRHFRSRGDVLDEVVVKGFERLSRSMHERSDSETGDERLVATGLAYLDFARAEPNLFALMFGPDGAAGRERSFAAEFGVPNAAEQLRSALAAIGRTSEADFLHGWGLAHGLAALAAAGTGGTPEEQERTIRDFASAERVP